MDNLLDIFLVIVSIVGIASASYVVAQTNVFRAALALALSFMTVAVVFFAINAEFLGAVQILVYIGAVSVLMAFSVLLVKDLQTASSSTVGTRFMLSSVSSLLIFVVLVLVILGTDWNKTNQVEDGDFRQALFEKYVIDEENKMIITNLDKNDNILDIGAQYGQWTKLVRKYVYPDSYYQLIEPINYNELDNLKKFNNISCINILLGNKEEEVVWYEKRNGGDSIYKENTEYYKSCKGINKFTKKKLEASIINCYGEWDAYGKILKKKEVKKILERHVEKYYIQENGESIEGMIIDVKSNGLLVLQLMNGETREFSFKEIEFKL